MIKFSDIVEKSSNAENIEKHSDRMTNQEIDAFWKVEFQKAHDEAALMNMIRYCLRCSIGQRTNLRG